MTDRFENQKDDRGEIAKKISETFGLVADVSVARSSLVEVRDGDGVISITAHSDDKFSELVVYDAGKTKLKETNAVTGKHNVTTLWPDGRVEQLQQSWNNRTGLTGTPQKLEVPDSDAVRRRVQGLARRVLPLARDIK